MTEFQVVNQVTGHVYQVRTNETILDALLRQGTAVPYSCRNGTCAACKCQLVSGEVTYEDYDRSALTDAEIASGSVLLCRAHPIQDLEIHVAEIDMLSGVAIQKLPCRVIGLNQLSPDVMEAQLALPRDTSFHFIAGQYIDVITRDNKRRGFSIASAPGGDLLTLHVRHVPNGRFTTHLFQSMKIRDILRFEGPLGTFFLRHDSDLPIIMIAGGTGFAPLKSILENVFNTANTMRQIHLFWGVRALGDLYQHTLVQQWSIEHHTQFQFTAVLSEPQPIDQWEGETGWVHEAVLRHYPDLTNYEVYASGPPPMIEEIRHTFPNQGLAANRLFYDSFEFSSDALYPSASGA